MKTKDSKNVIYWLLTGCFLIFIMVIIGGITRLTDSGLSISNYKLLTGTIPPIGDAEWQDAFELYQQHPEFKHYNSHFTISDFKSIYFWEWLHRLIGRMIGLVFFFPFVYFLITKQLTKSTIKKCIVLLGLGGFQGFLGWYMVKSGLVDMPDVSHFRLAAHLTAAFLTFAATLWVALDLIYPTKKQVNTKYRNLIIVTYIVLLIQIIYGAFIAGLKAGLLHNHWPLMNDGKFIHPSVYAFDSFTANILENPSGIQFVHRMLAIVVVSLIVFLWYKSKPLQLTSNQKKAINALLILVVFQFLLGVFTLILYVPVWLGVLHQVGAFFLLTAMTFKLHRFSK
ncbi:COX15/CtaA family protein [Formosa algae]|uniref:Heme A synthase n=1 Tax=Formosa algae TaxID=225843 RepID=A0A9X1CBY6_9FLAO|nr:COX15/CtaA family protein [Formosa algae]MBP1839614.1 cytochrome c oxidase assembly protein subunit 15 [Formosa algae]MDQ0334918.1 cytochrome c oxidase assembly protein subunit 15 [Formosa algae]OEI80583.1 heme A synthase [Formosa algae]